MMIANAASMMKDVISWFSANGSAPARSLEMKSSSLRTTNRYTMFRNQFCFWMYVLWQAGQMYFPSGRPFLTVWFSSAPQFGHGLFLKRFMMVLPPLCSDCSPAIRKSNHFLYSHMSGDCLLLEFHQPLWEFWFYILLSESGRSIIPILLSFSYSYYSCDPGVCPWNGNRWQPVLWQPEWWWSPLHNPPCR